MGAYRITKDGETHLSTTAPDADTKIVIGGEEITDAEEVAAILAIRAKKSAVTVEKVEWEEAVTESTAYVKKYKPLLTTHELVRKDGSVELLKQGKKPADVRDLAQTPYSTLLDWVEPTIKGTKTLIVDAKVKAAIKKAAQDEKDAEEAEKAANAKRRAAKKAAAAKGE